MNDILDKVIGIVSEACAVGRDEVSGSSAVGDFPAWDSMGHLSILSNVEAAFGISFDPEEMMDLEDVDDIVRAVQGKRA